MTGGSDAGGELVDPVQIRSGREDHAPPSLSQRVQPSPVPAELTRLGVPQPVVFDGKLGLRVTQVDSGNEPPVSPNDVLRHEAGQPAQHQPDSKPRFLR